MEAVRKRDELLHARVLPDLPSRGLSRRLASDLLSTIEKQRRQTTARRWLWQISVLIGVLGAGALGFEYWNANHNQIHDRIEAIRERIIARVFPEQRLVKHRGAEVLIPAGRFIFQDGQERELPPFYIDATEVTVGQYMEFLRSSGDRKEFDHPDQPKTKRHTNLDWQEYARAAMAFGSFRGIPVTPNCPAVFVDWFDADRFRLSATFQKRPRSAYEMDRRTILEIDGQGYTLPLELPAWPV